MADSSEEPRQLLETNLDLVERLIRFVSRQKISPDEIEDFASWVKLRLIDGDYAVLRKYDGRVSLATYLTIVIRRLLSDYQIHLHGKWHTSAKAQRLGPDAVQLERLLYRDHMSLDRAMTVMSTADSTLTRAKLEQLAVQLPERSPQRSFVSADEIEFGVPADQIESDAMASDRHHAAGEIAAILEQSLRELSPEDALILRMHFVQQMSVAEIARSLTIEQKPLYRRLNSILGRLRQQLETGGIAAADVADIIGRSDSSLLDFGFLASGPSQKERDKK